MGDEYVGFAYQVQVEVPEQDMSSLSVGEISLKPNSTRPVSADVATIKKALPYGRIDDMGAIPYLSVRANLNNTDLGKARKGLDAAIAEMGEFSGCLSIHLVGGYRHLDRYAVGV